MMIFIKGMAKPLALDGYVPAFSVMVLVYKYDVVDIHGVMHHRGIEELRIFSILLIMNLLLVRIHGLFVIMN